MWVCIIEVGGFECTSNVFICKVKMTLNARINVFLYQNMESFVFFGRDYPCTTAIVYYYFCLGIRKIHNGSYNVYVKL